MLVRERKEKDVKREKGCATLINVKIKWLVNWQAVRDELFECDYFI